MIFLANRDTEFLEIWNKKLQHLVSNCKPSKYVSLHSSWKGKEKKKTRPGIFWDHEKEVVPDELLSGRWCCSSSILVHIFWFPFHFTSVKFCLSHRYKWRKILTNLPVVFTTLQLFCTDLSHLISYWIKNKSQWKLTASEPISRPRHFKRVMKILVEVIGKPEIT